MLKLFHGRGLVWKITFASALILLVPTAAVCMIYYHSYRESLLRDAKNRLSAQLEGLEYTMDARFDAIEGVIAELEYREEFPYYLDGKNVLSDREQRHYTASMEGEMIKIRYLYPSVFYQIVVYGENRDVAANDSWQFSMDTLKGKPYYPEIAAADADLVYGSVRRADFLVSTLDISNLNLVNDRKQILPVYLKIRNLSTGKPVGVLEVDMTLEKLTGGRSLADAGGEGNYLLYNRDGELLYTTGELPQKSTRREFAGERGVIETRDGHLMAYGRSKRSGLTAAVALPMEQVLKPASTMVVRVVVAALAVGLCVVMFTYLVMRRLLKRLLVLDGMMARVESGRFDLVPEQGGGEDEISRVISRFNQMAANLQTLIDGKVEREKAQQEAELSALQAQINPHFLYNTLENMRMQCEIEGCSAIGDSLAALGDLFRYSVKWGSHKVPFSMEWENLKNYLAIMKMRYDGDLKCILELGEGIGNVIVPKMLLQPLVENSFSHGFKDVLPPWMLMVRAYRVQDWLTVVIEDNGCGIGGDRLLEIRQSLMSGTAVSGAGSAGKSIGVVNVKQRMDRICPEGSGIEFESEPGRGVRIVVRIRMEEEE